MEGLKVKEFNDGEIIFEEGESGEELYLIKEGEVKIFRHRKGQDIILARLKRGDFFGEMSVFTGEPRSASAQAVGKCKLRVISKDDFKSLIREPETWHILEVMSRRIREFDDKIEGFLVDSRLRKVISLFRKYVAPQVVDEILKFSDSDVIDLSGELREVTVLFADIRNFTTIAENLQPQEVSSLLNTYLGEMTHVIFRYDGTVDKYIGDAIMVVFNAPVRQENHAWLAVSAAFRIQERVLELKKNNPSISVGIGINTGKAIIGNVGTDLHLDYTVIGDAVNVAARLCQIAQPGELLISDETYQKVKEHVEVEDYGWKKLKGKREPVKVCNVTGLKSDIKHQFRREAG